MSIQKNKFHKVAAFLGASIAALSLIFFAGIAVQGQTVSLPSESDEAVDEGSVHGIIFPIFELGNCASKNECKNYCNQAEHMDACIAFAKDHGLITEKDAARAEKFASHVREGSGPGGCNSPQSCEQYCGNLSHLDECTTFAEKNGFKGDQYEHGKKIQAFLKNGGTTPGNCQTKEECQKYCGEFSHAKECFVFAQKAGIMQKGDKGIGDENRHEPNIEQLGKIAELSEKGETPGHCASKDECEKYCSNQSHREECLDFGVKIGFIKPDDATKIKQLGGKGPGNCNSQESCRAYCNDQSHQEECFKFAEEHGFMTKGESEKAKEGWVRAKQGFENAPPEVRECLKTTLGENIIDDIQSGKLVPGPDIGTSVRGCFEKFGKNIRPQEALKNLPPEVAVCLKEKFGDTFEGVRTGKTPMTPAMADSFHVCFQIQHVGESQNGGTPEKMMENILRSAPPEVASCIKEKFPEGLGNIQTGDMQAMAGIKDKIRSCFESFRPVHTMTKPISGEVRNEGMNVVNAGKQMENMMRSAPPEVTACIKGKFPEGFPSAIKDPQAGMEIKEKIQSCFENFRPAHSEGMTDVQKQGFNGTPGQIPPKPEFERNTPPPAFTGGLANMPPEVLACIRGNIGEDGFAKLQTAPPSLELIGIIRTCMEKMSGSVPPPLPPPQIQPEGVSQPVTILEKLIGAALLPARWIFGK